jgi:hypothetical protein
MNKPFLLPRREATVSPRAVHSETTWRYIMILGMSTSAFTLFHVVVSLIGIVTGIIVAVTMLGSKTTNGWTAIFLATTALTSITGFLFPRDQVLPSHIVGAVSLLVLIIAIAALYGYRLARSWRWIYVVSALVALYLNVFVLVAQAFLKVAILNALAPTPSDPGFIVAQLIVLALFVVLGIRAVRRFHPEANASALRPA